MAIYRGAGGSGDATQDAASEVLLALQAKDAAIAAQAAAEAAQVAAELAETNAETAETNAETAETNAETAETNAETAETNAAASASAASTSATNAAASASTATTQATNAASSASSASTSASNASTSASAASTSATNAANSATSASGSASTATTQATNASNSASSASTSATNAANSATAAAASAASINPASIVITGGSINGTTIGATTANTGAFTTLAASGTTTLSGNQIISVTDNSNAALHITQLGTGNALLVEDSANPDSTPFVIDASGKVVVGNTTAIDYSGFTPNIQVNAAGPAQIGLSRFSANTAQNAFTFLKSRGATVGDFTSVASGDNLGSINFYGADGTTGIFAASVLANCDGTPGTNDMPGRLVFSTTADGASSPTERMRIDSTGAVGIGTTSLGSGYGMRISKTLTGVSSGIGLLNTVTANSTITNLFGYNTSLNSATNSGTPYTISSFFHYNAAQGTINADSTVTNQFGYTAASSLTGATNNYGFYGNIASGTDRWNFYAAGTAANYFAGTVQTGSTISVGGATPSTSGAGITFPATQSASSNANTLDDYEEGTWTPVVTGSSTAGTGTYSSQEGCYTKIGNMVIAHCFITWSAHTGTGDFTITGLPFTSNGSLTAQVGSIYASEFNAGTNATQLIAYPATGSTAINFRGFVNNALRTVPAMDSAASVGVTLTYRV